MSEYNKQYYLKNKEKILAYSKEYYNKNKPTVIKRTGGLSKNNPEQRMYYSAKSRAFRYGIDFSIDKTDITIPERCPYLDVPIVIHEAGSGRHSDAPSLDRINPSLGYVKGNVQVISDLANVMKNNASLSELLTFAQNIIKLHGGTEPTKADAQQGGSTSSC